MEFSPPEYCRLFAQKKAYQGGLTGTPGPPLATPLPIKPVEDYFVASHDALQHLVATQTELARRTDY